MIEIANGIFTINNNDGEIFVIGDIHGDFQCLIHILVDLCKTCYIDNIFADTECNITNREKISWIPKNNSILVFCGDLIHRKRFNEVLDDECSDIYILKTLMRLKKESQKYGGDVLIIAGNHEVMNIINPNDSTYISEKNIDINYGYFTNIKDINEFIANSYAWIKINNIVIAHGGLCSDYLNYLDDHNINKQGENIISFINDKYREYFNNFDYKNLPMKGLAYDLMHNYDFENKSKHNLFWCREWGYNGIDCEKYNVMLKKINASKMIISHCPQFLSPGKPQMINFECVDSKHNDRFNLARVDLGMSRCFECNTSEKFLYYLENNHNRKISVLRLKYDPKNNDLYFKYSDSIVTNKFSCLQYLLLKYGLTLKEWNEKGIKSNWLGFEYIDSLLTKKEFVNKCFGDINDNNTTMTINKSNKSNRSDRSDKSNKSQNGEESMMHLVYPVCLYKNKLDSINQYNKLLRKNT